MKRTGLFFLCIAGVMQLYAQSKYNGMVVEQKNNNPLETVSVSLLSADSSIIDYTYTNAKGVFEIETVSSPRFLSFSSMGYKRMFLPVSSFRNGMAVTLEEAPIQIREVKVTSQRIRQVKDTLTYTVSGFKMPQDRSIEDVLKKIPGIEVEANGTIKFQDKAISNFYIEGMNLLEGKYTLASKNIPANMVKEVQVLQSHQPIAALRGKSFSDNAALNLTLSNGAKNRIVKLFDLGAGAGHHPDFLWDNRLLGMIFGKDMQNLTMYKNNNTGKDIAAEIVPLTYNRLIGQTTNDNEENFFSSSASQAGGVGPERYLFNNAHLIAVNHLYKPNKKTDLRLQLSALHDETTANHQSSASYFYPSQTITINEQEEYAGQENRGEGELTYQLNDSSVFIKNTLKGTIGLHKSSLGLIVNNEKSREQIHPQRKYLQNRFELIKNFGNRTLSVYTDNAYTELPQYMTVSPGLYENILNEGQDYESFRQNAKLRAFRSDTYSYFQHKLSGIYLKYKAGVTFSNRTIASDLQTDNAPADNSKFSNDVRLTMTKLYLEPSFNFQNYYWKIQLGIPLAYHHSTLNCKIPQSEQLRKSRFMPTPRLNIAYEINSYWIVNASSLYSYSEPDIYTLYANYIFSSYRSASAFEPQLTYNTSWANSLRLRFNNPLTGLFISISGFYTLNRQDIIYGYENSDMILSLCKTYHHPYTSYISGARSRISKTFAWSKLFMAVNANYSQRGNKILLENQLTASTTQNAMLGFEYSLQPRRYINVEGSSSASYMKSLLEYESSSPVEVWHFKHKLDINLIFSSQWRAKLGNSLSHDNKNKQATYFADASLAFSHQLFDIEASVHNLFNHSHLDNIYIDNLTEQYTSHTLRPREFMIKVMFSF